MHFKGLYLLRNRLDPLLHGFRGLQVTPQVTRYTFKLLMNLMTELSIRVDLIVLEPSVKSLKCLYDIDTILEMRRYYE